MTAHLLFVYVHSLRYSPALGDRFQNFKGARSRTSSPFHQKMSSEVVRGFNKDASWAPSFRDSPGLEEIQV